MIVQCVLGLGDRVCLSDHYVLIPFALKHEASGVHPALHIAIL